MIKSRRIRWAEHVAIMGEKRKACRILVGKPEGKRQLVRRRCMWVDNIKISLRVIGWGDIDWIDLAQDIDKWRVSVNTLMKFRVPQNFGKFLSGCKTGGFSRWTHVRGVS
jgi:hypothetical protein